MGISNNSEIEILAPAGSYDAFVAAVNAGAHAVYMGVNKFNARTMANNLTIDQYIDAIDYAHKRDVKVYLTLNTLLFDNEIKEALEIVLTLYNAGLDAVIVQDLGIATLIHKIMPDLPLHASTQMSVLNLDQVKYLENLGFARVVLGRELSVEEIAEISKNTKLEIEIFVHGALCVSVSGQCMASALIGDRSANRGSCAQPCRMKYTMYAASSKTPVIKDRYILSKKDIFGLDKLESLAKAGVKSFKIEGRNRTVEYTAGVVSRYRAAVDNNYESSEMVEKELLQLFNRSGKSEGYLSGVRYKNSISYNSPKNTGLVLGKVLTKHDSYIKIKLEENIDLHDGIEIQGKEETVSAIVTCIKDEKKKLLNKKCLKGDIVYIGDIKGKIEEGDLVYKTSSNELNNVAREYLNSKAKNKRIEYDVYVNIKQGKNIAAGIDGKNINIEVEYIPEQSKTTGITLEKLQEVFTKTEDTAVILNISKEDIDSNLFVPVSKLNELRRTLVEEIEKSKCIRRNKSIQEVEKELSKKLKTNEKANKATAIYMYKYDGDKDYIKYCGEKYNTKLNRLYISARDFKIHEKDIIKYLGRVKVYFVIPNVVLSNMERYIKSNVERLVKSGISGLVIGNTGYLELGRKLKQKYNIELIGDYTLNVTNKYTAGQLDFLDYITPLFETEQDDLEGIAKVTNIELVEGLATAMTTRYCMLASFVGNVSEKDECQAICKKDNYYILDSYGKKYNVVPDNTDCITELVRNKRKYTDSEKEMYSIRYNVM